MIDFKYEIAKKIADATNIEEKEILNFLEEPKDFKNGEYAFPCFKLSKELKKSPVDMSQTAIPKYKPLLYIDII